MLDQCAALGLNTILLQVRPFGDAIYPSALYPWSHICTGTQGVDPGFDPLDLFLTEAHNRGLSVEGWINPYRLRASAASPAVLAGSNLANTHPEWVVEVSGGLYLNPAIPEAAAYVVEGVAELVRNYPVDGGSTLTTTSTPPPTPPWMRPSLPPAAPPTWGPGGGRTSPPW